jgi:hypothetical protein
LIAAVRLDGNEVLLRHVKADFRQADILDKSKAFIYIAGNAQRHGKHMTFDDIEEAHKAGTTDNRG